MKKRLGIIIFIAVDLLILLAVVLITFSHTKDYYKVRFDLNGGILISGELEQTVRFGHNAVPPKVTKDGEIFLEWSDDFTKITEDKVIYALWDHESTFGLEFEVYLNGNYSLVSGAFDSITGDVYVSAYYQQRRVLGVNDGAFEYCNRMTSVTLPDGMFSIGDFAFNGCSSLNAVKFPNSLVTIGDNAFAGCRNLSTIELPNTVVSIGNNAFSNCEKLTSISLGSNIEDISGETFNGMVSLESIIVSEDNPYYTSIDGNLYSKDGKILIKYATGKVEEVFNVPDSVEVIADYAFENAVNLKKINVSNNLYEISANAIYQCENLEYNVLDGISYFGNEKNPYLILKSAENLTNTSVVLPDDVRIISAKAFKDLVDLKNVEIGKGLLSIGDEAFSGCINLEQVKVPLSLKTIGNSAFNECLSLTSFDIPSGVTKISNNTFYNCTSLQSISLSKNLKVIGNDAFYNCTSLEDITLPNALTEIGSNAFYNCTNIKEMNVPKNVQKIGIGFIAGCASLQKLTVPFIGEELDSTANTNFGYFFGTSQIFNQNNSVPQTLKSLTITKDVTIDSNAFYNCKTLEEIYLPNTLRKVGSTAFTGCNNLKDVYFAGDGDDWCKIQFTDATSLPNYYKKTVYFLNEDDEYSLVEEVILTSTVLKIGDYQFSNFGTLKNVITSNSVKEISACAFRFCDNLEYIYIGDSVETICVDAFNFCPQLKEYEVSINNQYLMSNNGDIYSKDGKTLFFKNKLTDNFIMLDSVERVEAYAFYNNPVETIVFSKNLKSIGEYAFYGCEALLDFVLPESLEEIEGYAFYGCKMIENIVVPNSVTSVGNSAFYGCVKLQTVKLSNKMVEISLSLFYNCSSLKTVVIPDSIKLISSHAFRNCRKLENVILPNSLKTIGAYAFCGCSRLTELYIPISVENVARYAIYSCPLLNIKCEAEPMPDGWNKDFAKGYKTLVWSVENPRRGL